MVQGRGGGGHQIMTNDDFERGGLPNYDDDDRGGGGFEKVQNMMT